MDDAETESEAESPTDGKLPPFRRNLRCGGLSDPDDCEPAPELLPADLSLLRSCEACVDMVRNENTDEHKD